MLTKSLRYVVAVVSGRVARWNRTHSVAVQRIWEGVERSGQQSALPGRLVVGAALVIETFFGPRDGILRKTPPDSAGKYEELYALLATAMLAQLFLGRSKEMDEEFGRLQQVLPHCKRYVALCNTGKEDRVDVLERLRAAVWQMFASLAGIPPERLGCRVVLVAELMYTLAAVLRSKREDARGGAGNRTFPLGKLACHPPSSYIAMERGPRCNADPGNHC